MEKNEFIITNEVITNAKNEDELIKIFNEKLATLLLMKEKLSQ